MNFLISFKIKKFKKNFKNFSYFFFFFKKTNNFFNSNLVNILLFSKFFFSYSDLNYFLNKNYIFINRIPFKESNLNSRNCNLFLLKKNDFLEIIYNKYYFIYLKKKNNYLNVFQKNKEFYFKNSKLFYKSNFLKKLNNLNNIFFNKFLFFEIDFKTLTIIFLYLPYFNLSYNLSKNNLINKNLLDYYKWKKLT